MSTPSFDDLTRRTDAPAGSAWGVFGADDDLGTVSRLTPERVRAALQGVRRGAVFNLDYPLNTFRRMLKSHRQPAEHVLFSRIPEQRDDYLNGFYLQSDSHLDGLRHRRHSVHGFYNGTSDAEIQIENPRLGVSRWAEHGIVGRGVLIDVDRYLRAKGRRLDHRSGEAFSVQLVDEVAAAQGTAFASADILLLRTGWCEYLFNELTEDERRDAVGVMPSAGLVQSRETLAWLWDHEFAVVAADNRAVEALPPVRSSPYGKGADDGLMHQEMLALLGLAIGELWKLDELAADCSKDGVYECAVVSKPLMLIGGVGSPANALAIK